MDSFPKKRMGAGCLFFDEQNRLLLVKPVYKPGWEIPGGIVEPGESPGQCCLREVQEELGIQPAIGRLLVVDYNSPSEERTESLMFIFDGGMLTPAEIDAIQLRLEEISEFRFFSPHTLPREMMSILRDRVWMAWQQSMKENGVYLENQKPIPFKD